MGFDLYIYLKLMMCPETGKPYYFGPNLEKVYTLPGVTIPEHLHKYLKGRGSQFHAYVHEFTLADQSSADVNEFLNEYPLWKQITSSEWYDETWEEYWTEKEHDEFRELLVYLNESLDCQFTVEWSY
jgi:hypothetical protein